MGLYGNILVDPSEPEYWPPPNRELLLTLDDILIEEGKVAAFSESETTHVAMGRFGNVMLVAGEPDLSLTANRGEVVRLYLTNTANTRVFNVRCRALSSSSSGPTAATTSTRSSSRRCSWLPQNAWSSTCTSRNRASSSSSTELRSVPIDSPTSPSARSQSNPTSPIGSRCCGRTRT